MADEGLARAISTIVRAGGYVVWPRGAPPDEFATIGECTGREDIPNCASRTLCKLARAYQIGPHAKSTSWLDLRKTNLWEFSGISASHIYALKGCGVKTVTRTIDFLRRSGVTVRDKVSHVQTAIDAAASNIISGEPMEAWTQRTWERFRSGEFQKQGLVLTWHQEHEIMDSAATTN